MREREILSADSEPTDDTEGMTLIELLSLPKPWTIFIPADRVVLLVGELCI